MKKLNIFELKQMSGGDSGEVKHISDLVTPAPRDFVTSLEEFEHRMRGAGRARIPGDPGMYVQVILKVMAFHDGEQSGVAGLFLRRRFLK